LRRAGLDKEKQRAALPELVKLGTSAPRAPTGRSTVTSLCGTESRVVSLVLDKNHSGHAITGPRLLLRK
jgi:hypothetical protein